jgi:hypothetical protein
MDMRLEDLGQFVVARAKERAKSQGKKDVKIVVRHGKLRSELIETAREMDATTIVLGRPMGKAAVFKEDTLLEFAEALRAETGIEVLCL